MTSYLWIAIAAFVFLAAFVLVAKVFGRLRRFVFWTVIILGVVSIPIILKVLNLFMLGWVFSFIFQKIQETAGLPDLLTGAICIWLTAAVILLIPTVVSFVFFRRTLKKMLILCAALSISLVGLYFGSQPKEGELFSNSGYPMFRYYRAEDGKITLFPLWQKIHRRYGVELPVVTTAIAHELDKQAAKEQEEKNAREQEKKKLETLQLQKDQAEQQVSDLQNQKTDLEKKNQSLLEQQISEHNARELASQQSELKASQEAEQERDDAELRRAIAQKKASAVSAPPVIVLSSDPEIWQRQIWKLAVEEEAKQRREAEQKTKLMQQQSPSSAKLEDPPPPQKLSIPVRPPSERRERPQAPALQVKENCCSACFAMVFSYDFEALSIQSPELRIRPFMKGDEPVVDGIWTWNGNEVGRGISLALRPARLYELVGNKAGTYFLNFTGHAASGNVVSCGLHGTPITLNGNGLRRSRETNRPLVESQVEVRDIQLPPEQPEVKLNPMPPSMPLPPVSLFIPRGPSPTSMVKCGMTLQKAVAQGFTRRYVFTGEEKLSQMQFCVAGQSTRIDSRNTYRIPAGSIGFVNADGSEVVLEGNLNRARFVPLSFLQPQSSIRWPPEPPPIELKGFSPLTPYSKLGQRPQRPFPADGTSAATTKRPQWPSGFPPETKQYSIKLQYDRSWVWKYTPLRFFKHDK